MQKKQRRNSLILQVAVLFTISVLLTGFLTYFSQSVLTDASVKKQTEGLASEIADEVKLAVTEYPAYEWLLRYWYEHSDELDIEYDTDYGSGTRTEEKCRLLAGHYPGMQFKYADTQELLAMPEADQKLYAEITYSWLITRVNQIKRAYHVDFLFCVLTEDSYETQFFLFSGADPGSVRGTSYEEIYPLGVRVTVSASQQEEMRNAQQNSAHLADAGSYVDYYAFLDMIDDHAVLIGMTYDLSGLMANIHAQTISRTSYAVAHQVFLSLICLVLTSVFVLHPLKKVQNSIRLYKETKNSETVIENLAKIRPHNEIGQLSEDVMRLTKEIDDYLNRIQTITAEEERISTELSLATRIQAAMLPHIFPPFPGRPEFDIYATMEPARKVGGDFYDFFLVDDDHLCMVMADVSGKGVPAALFMMVSKIILQSCAMLGKSAAEILTKTNEAICSNNQEEMFVTVWVGILEISTGTLTAANAGHEYPVLKKPDGTFELIKDRHGLVIGGMEGTRYREYQLQMEPGAKLFLYTDGVAEATDAQNQLFGTDRMIEALRRAEDGTPEEILQSVDHAVKEFVGDAPQFDDLTMLCIHYIGKNREEGRNCGERADH